jgi:hypothetical protein
VNEGLLRDFVLEVEQRWIVQKEQDQMAEYMDMFDFLTSNKGQHSSCTTSQGSFAHPV